MFSTLHTNSAPESIVRLLDMGMDPFNFADALLGILAQRLAKKLCDCKQEYTPDADEIKLFVTEYAEELRHSSAWKTDYAGEAKKLYESWVKLYGHDGRLKFYKAVGCDKCNKTGYKGRLGLHELLVADDHIKRLIQERARVAEMFLGGGGERHAHPEDGRHGKNHAGADRPEAGAVGLYQVGGELKCATKMSRRVPAGPFSGMLQRNK